MKYTRWLIYIIVLLILLLFAIGLSLSIGELNFSIFDIPKILNEGEGSVEYSILKNIRLPRVWMGLAVGGALSLSGVILQGIYHNPLVEPYTLGISGGAALGVAFTIVFGLHFVLGAFMLPMFGFIGAFISITLVYFISLRHGKLKINSMLLIGVMISFISSSLMMLLMAITTTENLHGIVFWIMGSLEEPNQALIQLTIWVSVFGLIASYFLVQSLNALRLGEEKARHLGINTDLSIRLLFVIASLLAGVSVAVAGVIGFVGLVIPHIMRILVGSDFRILLLSSFLGGSIFLILCDALARVLILPNQLPIGVITGIVGGITFVIILSRTSLKINKS